MPWEVGINISDVAEFENNMRKRLKKKNHSCGLCKPHKLAGANRWKNKDSAFLKEFERIKERVLRGTIEG